MKRVDQVEESCGIFFFHREEHDVVNSHQIGFKQPVIGSHGRGHQAFHFDGVNDILHGYHICLVSFLYSFIYESCGDEGFTCSGRPHKYYVVILFKPSQATKISESGCGYALRVVVIEKIQVMSWGYSCCFQASLEVPAFPLLNLAGQQVMKELDMGLSLFLRYVASRLQQPRGGVKPRVGARPLDWSVFGLTRG